MSFDITYEVDLSEIIPLIDEIDEEVLVNSKGEVLDEIGEASRMVMRREAPYGWRNRGPHLRDTIIVEHPDSETVAIGPTKKVDGLDLGVLLHRGTKGGTIITPKRAPYLWFFWKKAYEEDKKGWIYAKKVTRGATAPNPFVERTKAVMDKLAVGIWQTVMNRRLRRIK